MKISVGALGKTRLVRQSALCQQALQFRFCFGAQPVGKSIGALPVLGAQRGQARMQVRLVLFHEAQQALRFGDSLFQ